MKAHSMFLSGPSPLLRTSGAKESPMSLRLLLTCCLLLAALVQPIVSKAQTSLTIGTGTSNSSLFPVNAFYGYSYSQTTYLASDIIAAGATAGTPGYISSISYNAGTYASDFGTYCKDWVVYMGSTTKTTFSGTSDWVAVSGLTKVFDGIAPCTGTGYFKITFSTPFYWDGVSNIIVAVDENTPGFTSSSMNWKVTTTKGSTRSLLFYDDGTNPDPSSPPTATNTGALYPNIKIDYLAATPCSGSVTGGSTIASTTASCPGKTVNFSVTGSTAATGITYQWDTSSTGVAGSFNAIPGATAMTLAFTPPTGRTLYYRRRLTCTSTSSTDASTTVSVSVSAVLDPPYTETFEGATPGVNVACASALSSFSSTTSYSGTDYWKIISGSYPGLGGDNHTLGGSKYLVAGYYVGSYAGSGDGYWFTPGLNLLTGKTYRFSYWYRVGDDVSAFEDGTDIGMYYGTSQTASGLTAIKPDILGVSTNVYTLSTGDFTVPTSGVYYMAIKANNQGWAYYGGGIFDDIGLIALPDCNTATVSTFSAGGKASASPNLICSTPGTTTLSLSGAPAFSGLSFEWQRSDGSNSFATPTIIGTSKTLTSSIATAGNYYFRCKVTCSSTGFSAYSDTVKVGTAPITPPYVEDFETATVGVNQPCASYTNSWETSASTSFFNYWGIKAMPGKYYPSVDNHTTGGSKYLSSGYYVGANLGYPDGDQQYWFSPALALTSGNAYECSYWYVSADDGTDAVNYGLYYGTTQTAAAMVPMRDDIVGETNSTYKQIKGSFVSPTTNSYYLGVKVNHSYGNYGGAVDDIGVIQLPDCAAKPSAGRVAASPTRICTSGTARLTLAGSSIASKLKFQWQDSAVAPSTTWANVTTGTGGTTSVFTTPTLSASRKYRCIITCPLAPTPNADTSKTFVMSVGPIIPPYVETFETTPPGSNVACGGATNWGSPDYFYTAAGFVTTYGYSDLVNHTPGGSRFLVGGPGTTVYSGPKDYWFTPAITLTGGATYEFSYWYATDGYPYGNPFQLGTYVGTKQTRAGMTTALMSDISPSNTTYQQIAVNYTPATTNNYYFGIYVSGDYGYGLSIDDIGLMQLPPCGGKPSSGGIASVTPTMLCSPGTAKLALSSLPKVANLSFQWYQCDAAGNLGSSISGALTSPVFTTGTISSTTYFRCVVKCTLGAATDTTYSSVIKLDVGAITPPYIETFESGTPGINMPCASYTYGFGYSWEWNVQGTPVSSYDYGTVDNHTPGGSKYLIAGTDLSYYSGSPEYWFTPAITFTAGKLYQLSYWYQTDGYLGGGYGLANFMGVTQSAADMTIPIGTPFSPSNTTYKQFKTQFTATTSGNFYIGIRKTQSGYGYGIAIDDIGLQEVPPCGAPVAAGTVISDPTHVCSSGGTTNLDLDGTTLASGLTYEWFMSNTKTGPYVTTGSTALPYTTDPLASSTWFRAVVKCAASGFADTSLPYQVSVGAFDMPYIEDFESTGAGSVPLCSDATKWGSYFDSWAVYGSTIYAGYKNHTPGGKNFLIGGYELGSPSYPSEDNYWFTPGLNFRGGYKYDLSFYFVATEPGGSASKMGIYFGKAQNAAAMTTNLIPYRAFSNSTYQLYDTSFVMPSSGIYYLGFRKSGADPTSTYAYEGVAFDDINLNYAPCDGTPNAGVVLSTSPTGTQYCIGTSITLTNVGATIALVPGIKYQWQRRSLTTPVSWANIKGANDTTITADTLIGYEYRMAVVCRNTNDTAFSASFLLPQLPPHPPVTINPSLTPATFCLGDTVKFTATNFTGAVYDWMLDSVVVPGWKFSDLGAMDAGTYMVKVTSALSPCPAYSNQVTLNLNDPGYTVDITKPADSIVCEGTAVFLSGLASKPGVSYQWRKNNIAIPGATGNSYLATTTGYYRLVASDGSSFCPGVSRNVLITVKPSPPAVITVPGGITTACAEDGVRLNANLGAFSYEWQRGGTTVVGWTDSSQLIKNSGTYTVKVRTADGCVGTSAPVTVNILPSPTPIVVRTGDVLSTTTPFVNYQWIRNGSDIPGATASTYKITLKGYYKVRVIGGNNCTGESSPIEAMDSYLGIDNVVNTADQIKIYPNPTDAKVFIESPVHLDIEVKDIAGKTIMSAQDAKEIDLGKYADGVYLFMIRNNGELIKQQRVTKMTR